MNPVRFPIRWRMLRFARRLGFEVQQNLRVPSVFVTGSVGKTTTCCMTAAILAASGRRVGLATTTGCYANGRLLRRGDSSGCRWGALVTADRSVDVAVIELARGAILNEGAPFRGWDVGAVLNVYDNHLGLSGIDTREQLAEVKSVVAAKAERVVVLNADDPLVLPMRERTRAKSIYLVSRRPDNPAVVEHLGRGQVAAFLDPDPAVAGGMLRLRRGGVDIGSMPAGEVPATFGGLFDPAVTNALCAIAIAHGMGIDFATIRSALAAFHSDERDNPGRMNIHHDMPGTVLATKADGVLAVESLVRVVRGFKVRGRKILVVTAVGNRSDDWLRATGGAYAGTFSHHVCCDWEDPRGRRPGETANLLREGLLQAGVSEADIEIEPCHDAAIRLAHSMTKRDDLLVVASISSWRVRDILGGMQGCVPHEKGEAA